MPYDGCRGAYMVRTCSFESIKIAVDIVMRIIDDCRVL